jgi:hypothetical protein
MIAGAVTYDCKNISSFPTAGFSELARSNSSFGIGKGFMCNGANLA